MRLSALVALLPLAAAAPARRAEPAPLLVPGGDAQLIADKFIVKFRDGSALSVVEDALRSLAGEADHVYSNLLSGFSATLDKATLDALRDHPDVEYIEQDGKSHVTAVVEQRDAPWGLGRISHRAKGSSTYVYDDSAGEGTCSYILDTGIYESHPVSLVKLAGLRRRQWLTMSRQDFGGRAKQIKSYYDGEDGDGHGHGTHVAGTVGSNTYGVAKKTQLLGIKVLGDDGHGHNSAIISGMELVVTDSRNRRCPKGVLANMSLGGGHSNALNNAARNLVDAGVFVGVAAGNENKDAASRSPASEPSVCTVGGTAIDDTRYSGSNYGKAVKILAPGVDARKTGTSMATPHVVGLAAYLGSLEGLTGTKALCDRIRELATPNAITNQPSGTVNLLAFGNVSQ
ncbi:Subtilase serine protease [Tolypocladium paradoxum]|uniref:Subtilase serine protease n=1 Tax=Tolypocladium paradoxum TaxID=94208 RepID=A0A2S4L5S7_9HYPO|nr:Subtilase serine protease [Tolypocladium paradoxum]